MSLSSNRTCANRAWSKGYVLSSAASRRVSAEVASYWNRPVSVTMPAYRHAAASGGTVPPIFFISRNTTSAVDDAAGSTTGIVPSPSLLM